MELSIDLLRTFVTVSKINSFTKASCMLNMTQSAVSMQIKRLEEQTGTLFIRQGKSFFISPLGEKLLEHAVRILKAHDAALSVLANPSVHDHIRVGAPELYASSVFPKVLKDFYAKYPNSRVDFITSRRNKLLSMVESGELDIALCADMPYEYERNFSESLCWIASTETNIHEIRPLPLAVYPSGCHIRRWAEKALEDAGIEYRISFSAASVFALMSAVRAGIAVAPMGITKFIGEKDIYKIVDTLPPLPDNTLSIVKAEGFTSQTSDELLRLINNALTAQMLLV